MHKTHMVQVKTVLTRLKAHQLYVKAKKCKFHQTTIAFLCYIITHQAVQMDNSKVQAITGWPTPTSVKELQLFLAFANFYRRFIRNYSTITAPLTALLQGKPKKLEWTDSTQTAFNSLSIDPRCPTS